MKNDSSSLWPAVVEVAKVRFLKEKELGIDFSNEIDAWSKMEFRFRYQIKQMRQHGSWTHESPKELKALRYSFRQRIE
jgi:hypothetical protein